MGEYFVNIMFVVVFAVVVVHLARVFRESRERAPEESAGSPKYAETLGGHVGRRYSWPLVHLRLYDDLLVVSSEQKWVCRLDELEKVEPEVTWFKKELRLKKEGAPLEIRLRPSDPDELARRIETARRYRLEAEEQGFGETPDQPSTRQTDEEEEADPMGW